jgi:hypothetical protein
MNKKNPFKDNKHEIGYHIINSAIAGALVFAGACANGTITKDGIVVSIGAAVLTAIIKFKGYWATQEQEYTRKLITFI